MSSGKVDVAVKSMQQAQMEMIQWESRLEALKGEAQNLRRQNEAQQKDIENKISSADLHIAERMNEVARLRQELNKEREKMEAQKKEFEEIIRAYKDEKNAFDKEKNDALKLRKKAEDAMAMVDTFVVGVQRVYSTLEVVRGNKS